MRTITTLTPEEINQLRYLAHQAGTCNSALQRRCQCILYSYYGLKANDLMTLFEVDRRSIYNWMDRWEKGGIQALADKPGRGLKPRLSLACRDQVEQVRLAFQLYPNSISQRLNHVNALLSQPVSQHTLKRFVKKINTTRI